MTPPKPIRSMPSHDGVSSWLAKEWLVTNGVGGYASGSLLGIATRRYHGLFVPDVPGHGRLVIVPRLDETVEQDGGRLLLAGAEYADGAIDDDGLRCLEDFHRDCQAPVWTFNVGGSILEKRVVTPHGRGACTALACNGLYGLSPPWRNASAASCPLILPSTTFDQWP